MYASAHYLCPPDDGNDDGSERTHKISGGFPTQGEDLAWSIEVSDETRRSVGQAAAVDGSPSPSEPLPYAVELWDVAGMKRERVLGRAASILLANAVFAAAQADYAGRKLVLTRGDKVLAESA